MSTLFADQIIRIFGVNTACIYSKLPIPQKNHAMNGAYGNFGQHRPR